MAEWIKACAADAVDQEDVIRFDVGNRTFAIIRSDDDKFYCTDGLCTHEAVHLADGLVMGKTIECPKHSGEFNYESGQAVRTPACKNLKTYNTRVDDGSVYIEV